MVIKWYRINPLWISAIRVQILFWRTIKVGKEVRILGNWGKAGLPLVCCQLMENVYPPLPHLLNWRWLDTGMEWHCLFWLLACFSAFNKMHYSKCHYGSQPFRQQRPSRTVSWLPQSGWDSELIESLLWHWRDNRGVPPVFCDHL